MIEIINTWQFNIISALIGIVIFFQAYKLAVKDAQKDGAATILLQLIGGLSIFCLFPFLPIKFPSDIKVYLFLFLACIFYGLNDRLQTTSRKYLEVSVFSILGQLSTVFLILIGLFIFKEPFVLTKVFGAALILFANVFLFYEKGSLKLNKYAWIGILARLLFTVAVSIDIGISKQFNLPFYIMLTFMIPGIFIFFAERIKISEIIREYKSPSKKYYFIAGISWGLLSFFYLRSFQFGEVTTIVPIQSTSVLLNVLVAYFFLKERDNTLKKIIAAILVIIGITLTVGII
jgi:drug/metabolite transporter (DMT)-like permease